MTEVILLPVADMFFRISNGFLIAFARVIVRYGTPVRDVTSVTSDCRYPVPDDISTMKTEAERRGHPSGSVGTEAAI